MRFYHLVTGPADPPPGRTDLGAGRDPLPAYADEAAAAEALGFDGVCLGAHHLTSHARAGDPNVLAAAVAARTTRIRIAVVGNALPLHDDPLLLARTLATLDLVSAGRLDAGFVRGTWADLHSSRLDPTTVEERFWEGLDLIVRSWVEDRPFRWDGPHHYRPRVDAPVRPRQSPSPPVWLLTEAGRPTVVEAGWRGHSLVVPTGPRSWAVDVCRRYRQAAAAAGRAPADVVTCVPVHLAEHDGTAHEQAREQYERLLRAAASPPPVPPPAPGGPGPDGTPWAGDPPGFPPPSYDDLVAQGHVLVGSPGTVRDRLYEHLRDTGAAVHVGGGSILGAMPTPLLRRSMTIFARQVVPRLRQLSRHRPASISHGPAGPPTDKESTMPDISLDQALTLLRAVVDHAGKIGAVVAAEVVDASGTTVAAQRMDGCFPSAGVLARKKAYGALNFRLPTHVAVEAFPEPVRTALLAAEPGLTFLPGGVPVLREGVVVGALGVTGGAGEQDVACCDAALEALADGS
ncbi:LLM class flavin-dependent oxidoreductase [Micromonospora haikouensis]|uniref:LLM class flavin-dependent oxidoreductase n=1 Tax=Micromonospora haikouensis TaxID=686309 RepID=UPI003D759465